MVFWEKGTPADDLESQENKLAKLHNKFPICLKSTQMCSLKRNLASTRNIIADKQCWRIEIDHLLDGLSVYEQKTPAVPPTPANQKARLLLQTTALANHNEEVVINPSLSRRRNIDLQCECAKLDESKLFEYTFNTLVRLKRRRSKYEWHKYITLK